MIVTNRFDPEVAGIASGLIDSLRTARRNTTKPDRDIHTSRIAKAILRRDARQFACQHIAAILFDAFKRGAPEEDVQSFAHELRAEIHFLYTKRDGIKPKSLPEVHQAEEHAEGLAEEGEVRFTYDRSPHNASRMIEAKRTHALRSDDLVECARQIMRGVQS